MWDGRRYAVFHERPGSISSLVVRTRRQSPTRCQSEWPRGSPGRWLAGGLNLGVALLGLVWTVVTREKAHGYARNYSVKWNLHPLLGLFLLLLKVTWLDFSLLERGHPQQRGQLLQTQGLRGSGGLRAHRADWQCGGWKLHQHHFPQAAGNPRLPVLVPRDRPAVAVHVVPQPGGHTRLRAHDQLRPRHLWDAEPQCEFGCLSNGSVHPAAHRKCVLCLVFP